MAEEAYPYDDGNGDPSPDGCEAPSNFTAAVTLDSWVELPVAANNITMRQAIDLGPLSVAINANCDDFQVGQCKSAAQARLHSRTHLEPLRALPLLSLSIRSAELRVRSLHRRLVRLLHAGLPRPRRAADGLHDYCQPTELHQRVGATGTLLEHN
jgi:hypothetical protein